MAYVLVARMVAKDGEQDRAAEIIAYTSQIITLEPGDLIATGTPAGVGVFRDPKVLLQDGDEVSVEIEGLGTLTNPITKES